MSSGFRQSRLPHLLRALLSARVPGAHICKIVIFISAPCVHADKLIEVVLNRSCKCQALTGRKLVLLPFCCCSRPCLWLEIGGRSDSFCGIH